MRRRRAAGAGRPPRRARRLRRRRAAGEVTRRGAGTATATDGARDDAGTLCCARMDTPAALEELFAVEPERFVETRERLAAALAGEGKKDEARALKKLRK